MFGWLSKLVWGEKKERVVAAHPARIETSDPYESTGDGVEDIRRYVERIAAGKEEFIIVDWGTGLLQAAVQKGGVFYAELQTGDDGEPERVWEGLGAAECARLLCEAYVEHGGR